jgi:hypothetical protein
MLRAHVTGLSDDPQNTKKPITKAAEAPGLSGAFVASYEGSRQPHRADGS